MKTIVRNFGVVAVVLAAIAASAQQRARITIPFAFNAAGMAMPAGEYRVTYSPGNKIVTLAGERKVVAFYATYDFELNDPRTYLRFERFGGQLLLQQVAIAGSAQEISEAAGRKLIAAKAATENSVQDANAGATSVSGGN